MASLQRTLYRTIIFKSVAYFNAVYGGMLQITYLTLFHFFFIELFVIFVTKTFS